MERKRIFLILSLFKKVSPVMDVFPVLVQHLRIQQCLPGDKTTVHQKK